MTPNLRIYPALYEFRFFAALIVLISHVERIKGIYNLPNSYNTHIIGESARLAVTFFFVLSGFLIGGKILELNPNTIQDVKLFLKKRIARIWPLYFLLVLLAFIVIPQIELFDLHSKYPLFFKRYWYNLAAYLAFVPQIALAVNYKIPIAEQLWSIGTEEFFYLLLPMLFIFTKKPLKTFFILAGILLVARLTLFNAFLAIDFGVYKNKIWILHNIVYLSRLDGFAFGVALAWLVKQNHAFLSSTLLNTTTEKWNLLIFSVLLLFPIATYNVQHVLFGASSAILIANAALNPNSIIQFKSRKVQYLGKISFGIYVYHELMITVWLYVITSNLSDYPYEICSIIVYCGTILSTIVLAHFSYQYFERPILNTIKK